MKKKKKRIPKGVICAICLACVSIAIVVSLLITNIFIPIKYLSAYWVYGGKRTQGELRINYIDVGYGDCQIVELPDGKVLMIDSGDGDYSNEYAIFKKLNERGIDKIDYLICTSVNAEHCGGFAEILKYKAVGKAFIPYCLNTYITDEYYSFIKALKNKGVEIEYSGVGGGVVNDEYNYFFTFLSPTSYKSPSSEYGTLNENYSYENIINCSGIMWLEYNDTAFIFTSDAGTTELENLVNSYNLSQALEENYCAIGGKSVELDKCKVVTIAGHGSEDSLCKDFYALACPEIAICSVSTDNYYGCPSILAYSDVAAYAGKLYSTNGDGSVTITVTKDNFKVTTG